METDMSRVDDIGKSWDAGELDGLKEAILPYLLSQKENQGKHQEKHGKLVMGNKYLTL